jgi:para-nitrobenzyl esterase
VGHGTSGTGSTPEVRTTSGVVRGRRAGGISVFRGIPFAAPPVGALRLAAPRAAPPWDGVRPALDPGPPPPQSGVLGVPVDSRGDDWLTLDVWTPDPRPGVGLPVLVWVPGGGYLFGYGGLPEYDGTNLARGGTVVVTVSYRLGLEGFGQVDGAPPNRGLLDVVAALEWVRDNVSAFGGDPDSVTAAGQSAGGGVVASLLAMPRAAGLLRRAVVQSMPGVFLSTGLAADVAAACASVLGVRASRADLARVVPARLAAAVDTVSAVAPWIDRWGLVTHRPTPVAPVVDGDVLPTTPWRALASGAGRGVGLLAGHTRDEHRLFSLLDGDLGSVTRDRSDRALDVLAPAPQGADGYRVGFPDLPPEGLHELVESDWLFRMPSQHLAEAQVAGGGHAHLFELTWPAPGLGGGLGACHGLDVPLVFGNLSGTQPAALLGDVVDPAALDLSARMLSAWTAFVHHGDPGWPAYDTEARLTRVFDVPTAVRAYPEEVSRALWADHAFDPLPLLRPTGPS